LKFRRGRPEPVNVNLTPLIDVVFLLLIFFMVSTTFTRETRLLVDLPEATGEPAAARKEGIEVLVDETGNYRVNGAALADKRMATLQAALYRVAGRDTAQPLTISADADATHRSVVRVMDAAGQMGFVNLTIATLQPRSPPQE